MRNFDDLSEREMLALAISNEEEDARIYADFADGLHEDYPATAKVFDEMAAEENTHRRGSSTCSSRNSATIYRSCAGRTSAATSRRSRCGSMRPLGIDAVRAHAHDMERAAARFYRQALTRTTDASIRKLLGDLAEVEDKHDQIATGLEQQMMTDSVRHDEDENERRRFILQIIQPGLVGLMDGSVSTLAPVFAAAFATHNSWNAFVVGLAASIGAGISMGFAEALADDGKLSGRGAPLLRGLVCGLMTTAGGIGHTLPFLIPEFYTAMVVAFVVVVFELLAISYVQWRYMDTPPVSAAAKVMIGGALVLAAGILIGSS